MTARRDALAGSEHATVAALGNLLDSEHGPNRSTAYLGHLDEEHASAPAGEATEDGQTPQEAEAQVEHA